MIRIAVFLNSTPQWGGEYQYALLFMKILKKLPQDQYEVVGICGSRDWIQWCRSNKVKIIDNSGSNTEIQHNDFYWKIIMKIPKMIWKIREIYFQYADNIGIQLKENKIDICIYADQKRMPFYNIPSISVEHDLMHRYEKRFPEVAEGYWNREAKYRTMKKCTDVVIVDSKLGKKQFMESYMGKKDKFPKIVPLPYISPRKQENFEEDEILNKIKKQLPQKFIFYPAQFWQHKNHINLLKAVKYLENILPDIHLVLVGSPKNNGKAIMRYIKDNQIQDKVSIYGFVNDATIFYLYRNAVALVMPSFFGPTNIPPLEAMTIGCPVLVADKYAMPEQVGNAGLCFNNEDPQEIANCIKKVWSDKKLREEMIRKGRLQVQKWGEQEFASRLKLIIDKLAFHL